MTARKLFLATASLWFAACMGTGTDTENGLQTSARVTSAGGAPLANVEVRVHSLNAGPGTKTEDPLASETGTLRTDSAGYVHFTLKRAGRYMIEGQRGDTVLVLDTLVAATGDTAVFRTGGVQRLRGRVRLYSGYKIDTGFVFVRGSSIAAAVNRDGEYDFGYVPASASAMTLGAQYSAAPAARAFVKIADANGSVVTDAHFSLDSNLVPRQGGANLTLLKASQSATNVCLASAQQSVIPGISLRGSLWNMLDIRRAASFACAQKVGASIQVDESTLDGKSKKKLGDYVLPDTDIWPSSSHTGHGLGSTPLGQKVVVPAACLTSGKTTTYVTMVAKDSTGAQIRVDDIGLAAGCEF